MNKKYRLRKNEDFQKVFRQGKSFANRQFVVYFIPSNGLNHFRIGISVSKKLGNAVTRNRMKRLIREAIRSKLHRFYTDADIVVIVRKPAVDMDFHQINRSLDHVLHKAGLISSFQNTAR